jgi:hypothetical protein
MSKRGIIVVILIGVAIVVQHFIRVQITKEALKHFQLFDSTDMRGVIVEKSASQDRERFRLNNLPQEFVFKSKATDMNGFTFFYAVAEIGDSVMKASHSDTLRVIKANTNKVIYFTFRKW